MKAARIHQYGPPEVIFIDDLPRPNPGPGELLVRVMATGVGPWDALIREGKSAERDTESIGIGTRMVRGEFPALRF